VQSWSRDANQYVADEDDVTYSCRVSGTNCKIDFLLTFFFLKRAGELHIHIFFVNLIGFIKSAMQLTSIFSLSMNHNVDRSC